MLMMLAGCSKSSESVTRSDEILPHSTYPIRTAAFAGSKLEISTTDEKMFLVDIRRINVSIDENLDGTYLMLMPNDQHDASIFVRTEELKDVWEAGIKNVYNRFYAPRDVVPSAQ